MCMLLEQLLRVRVHFSACGVISCSATSAGFVYIREQSHVNTTSALGFVSWPPSFEHQPIVAVIAGLLNWPPLTSSLGRLPSAAFLDHLCRHGRRGASCRALVRPGPASWDAAFHLAQFWQTVVTQFWHRDATSKNHRWIQLDVKTAKSKARYNKQDRTPTTPMQLLPSVLWELCCLVGPIVGHGSRLIWSHSSNHMQ